LWASSWSPAYNWYGLIDLLMEAGYQAHLANPAAIKKYTGLKYADDQHDAFRKPQNLSLKTPISIKNSRFVQLFSCIS